MASKALGKGQGKGQGNKVTKTNNQGWEGYFLKVIRYSYKILIKKCSRIIMYSPFPGKCNCNLNDTFLKLRLKLVIGLRY